MTKPSLPDVLTKGPRCLPEGDHWTRMAAAAELLGQPVPYDIRGVSRWLNLVEPTQPIIRDWMLAQSTSPSPDPHAVALADAILVRQAEIQEWDQRAVEQLRLREQAAREEAARVPTYTDESWIGHWPLLPTDDYPSKGTPVVYWLYSTPRNLAYIGSTKQFLERMDAHLKDKVWTRWKARGCRTRLEAYRLEAIEIDKSKPPLNKPPRQRRGYSYVQAELKRKGGAVK